MVLRLESRAGSGLTVNTERTESTEETAVGGASLLSLSCSLDGYAVHVDGESLPVGTKRGLLGECEAHGVMEVGPG